MWYVIFWAGLFVIFINFDMRSKRSSHNSAASLVNGVSITLPRSAGATAGHTGAVSGTRRHIVVIMQRPVMLTGSESPPHPRCRIHRHSTSRSDSDSRNSTPVAGPSHDDLLTFSDDGNDNEDGSNGDEEDLEDSTPKGKKRAAPAGESNNRKRQRRQ
jgi:hypothetical protein